VSAIAGLVTTGGRRDAARSLDRMLETLAPYGPDRSSVWCEAGVALGHRLLAITAESEKDALPLTSLDGTRTLTADGRLDNRDELARMLDLRPESSAGVSDGEVILAAYDRWGAECPARLLGDFAFAIYDRPAGTLFCARDHMGVRPFYYASGAGQFAFASTLPALLTVPGVPRRLDERRIGDYLVPILEDPTITFFEGIVRLPAAHSLTVRPGVIRLARYWSLAGVRELRLASDADYAAAFRELFTQAVACRLRSVHPVGSTLSGGLDSSSVACVARRELAAEGRPLETFSAVFPDVPASDERRWIDIVRAETDLTTHLIRADRLSPLGTSDGMLGHAGQPFYAPNLYIHWALYQAARARGVRVFLDGLDGDTVLWQTPAYLANLARRGRLRRVWRDARTLGTRLGRSPRDILWRYALRPLMSPGPLRPRWLRAHRDLVAADFARRIGLGSRIRRLRSRRSSLPMDGRDDHRARLESGLVSFALEVAAAAARGLEPRYPFFDRRLVEFCLALPAEQKLDDGWTRIVLRRALAGVVPDQVRWRPGKSNLGPAFTHAVLSCDRPLLDEVVFGDSSNVERYVDLRRLQKTWRRALRTANGDDVFAVWRVASLALWLRREEIDA
jgi:asparagine synthase (glutamine-hydrolysing)